MRLLSDDTSSCAHVGGNAPWRGCRLGVLLVVLTACGVAGAAPGEAQEDLPQAPSGTTNAPAYAEDWVVRRWQTKEGLPQNTVNAMVQTRDGYLWVGTSGGLARFDGVRFRTFGLQDGLRSVRISTLLEDRKGELWVGATGGGVSRWDKGRFVALTGAGEPGAADVIAMAAEPDGTLWIGTDRGLLRWRDGVFSRIGPAEGLPEKQIRALCLDSKGTLWVSVLLEGFFQGTNGRFVPVAGAPPKSRGIYSLIEDREGSIWAGSTDGSLGQLRDGSWKHYSRTNGLPNSSIEALAQGVDNVIWAGSRNQGLYFFSEGSFHKLAGRAGAGLAEEAARRLLVDREGTLWAGTARAGLNRVSRRMLYHWGSAEGLKHPVVTTVAADVSGGLWVGAQEGGIYRFLDRRFSRLADPAVSTNFPYVYSALAAADGSVWVAGEQALFHYRSGKPAQAHLGPPIRGEAIRALSADGTNLWLGTYYSTLLKWDGTSVRVAATNGSFGGDIRSLVREAPDTLWIGSASGLYRWERGQVSVWNTRDGLLTASVQSLLRDPDGTLWIGTLGGGLARLKQGRIANITTRQGLIDDVISQIVSDDFGHLWLGCNHGIMRLEREELDDCANGRASFVYPTVFGQDDGMLSEQCSGGHSPTALKTKDGCLLFPTADGIAEVDPRRLEEFALLRPQAGIEEILVDGHAKPLEGTLVIPPGYHRLEVNYTAPSLRGGEWVRFRYRLEGADTDWVMAGSGRRALYEGLRPGRYVFQVAASDGRGHWIEPGASCTFVLQPFFWQTAWFRVVAALLLIGTSGGLAWFQMRRKHRRELAELERNRQHHAELARVARVSTLGELSSSLAHELNQPLGAILSNAEAAELFLQQDPPPFDELRDILAAIRKDDERAVEVIQRMRTLLRKHELESQPLAVNALVEDVLRLVNADAASRQTALAADLAPDLPPVQGDRIHLQQVLLNLILNAMDAVAKQPPENRRLAVRTRRLGEGAVEISVADSGMGIEPDNLPRVFEPFFTTKQTGIGMGLSISRKIVEAHQGRISAENHPAGGAVFRVTLPAGPEGMRDDLTDVSFR